MDKIRNYYSKIKKYGFRYSIIFAFVSVGYRIVRPFYVVWLNHFTKIDNNQILFASKPDISDNSKAMFDYLYNNYPEYKFIWIVKKNTEIPQYYNHTSFIKEQAKFYRGSTFMALRALATSKYIFFTHSSPLKYVKRKDHQLVINLWHGCGYKAVEGRKVSWIKDNFFDYALVPSNLFVPKKAVFWGCKESQILPIGYPRYDYFFHESVNGLKFASGIKGTKDKLIFWMPTFRNTASGEYPEEKVARKFDIPLLGSIEEMNQLDEYLSEHNIILCVKRHIFQLRYSCEDSKFDNIVFIDNDSLKANKTELYPVLRYTDALISDYSSVAIDYLLLDKPIAFCLDDFNEYNKTRGFVFENPLDYMPGHHLYTFDDLKSFVEDIYENNDMYSSQRNIMRKVAHNPTDYYCDRIWTTVKELEK